MKRRKDILASTILSLMSVAAPMRAQQVSIVADGIVFPIEQQQTQTEIKPGWKIVDIQLKSTRQRYLWGNTAKQYIRDTRPQFIIDTDTLLLSDMVVMKLKTKKEYRKIPKAKIQDNDCIYVDFNTFIIEPHEEESFLIRPTQPLEPGEYLITWTTLSPIGQLEDWLVWPFCIK